MLALFQLEAMEGGIFYQVFEPCIKKKGKKIGGWKSNPRSK